MKGWKIILVIFLVVGVVAVGGYFGFASKPEQQAPIIEAPPTVAVTICDVEQTVTAPGSVVNTRQVTLEMPVSGRLAEILVRPGDQVEAGQTLARLDDEEDFVAAVASAELDLLVAQAELAELQEADPVRLAEAQAAVINAQIALEDAQQARARLDYPRASQATIEQARTHYEMAQARFEEAQEIYEGVADLPADDPERLMALGAMMDAQRVRDQALITLNWYLGEPDTQEIAAADAQVVLAQSRLDAAQATLQELQAGPDSLELLLAQAKVDHAQAQLTSAQETLASLEITAPFSGVVLEVNALPGVTLPANTGILVLNDPLAIEIETTVIEEDLPYVEVSQPVVVYFDALPELETQGTVSRIVPLRVPGDRPLYYVYLTLDSVPERLIAGMTADASIIIASHESALCLPRSVVRAAADNTAVVRVWNGLFEEQRTVTVGLRGDTYVAILSGLEEGEQVVAR